MQTKDFQDIRLSCLGMGNMRLPMIDPKDPHSAIDWEKAHEVIDHALASGINYFDTAYVYNGGESERCLGACMKKHPRDSFYLATKFFIGANPDYRAVFEEQLERLQTDHIDFYLLHCLLDGNVQTYLDSGAIDYFLEQKAKGRIRYLGFSSHAGVEGLARFADHHAWDFAQLQINYFDWCYGTSAQEYQVLTDRHIPVVVMEPVRGGRLASLTPEAEELLKAARPDWSIPAWAMRFVRSLPNVQVVLSGMNTLAQVDDNVATFSDPETLSDADRDTLMKACDLFHSQLVVPCTGCRYCTDGCPMGINIPEYLKVFNTMKLGDVMDARAMYAKIVSDGRPADCVACGACTGHCPQSIAVPDLMAELAEKMK